MPGTKYPNFIDGFADLPLMVDRISQISADNIDRITKTVIAIETELELVPLEYKC